MGKYLIVGAGLFGSTLANLLHSCGKDVTVVEKECAIGGTCRTERKCGIDIHLYGAHIFKTNDTWVWTYVNQIAEFKPFMNTPIAISYGEAFNLPINMNTFAKLWNAKFPSEAKDIINSQIPKDIDATLNLENYAISKVGMEIYARFIKGYTEKQWNKPCSELPPTILGRLPIRFEYNNNYYDTIYQGIPVCGYTELMNRMLAGTEVILDCDGKQFVKQYGDNYSHIIYTGMIDDFYDNVYGQLGYRSLRFNTVMKDCSNYQGNAVFNYVDAVVPYTRVIEHSHFLKQYGQRTFVTYEYPADYIPDRNTPYYPIPTQENEELYEKYLQLSKDSGIIFSGRLGSYKYTDMAETVRNAKTLFDKLIKEDKE